MTAEEYMATHTPLNNADHPLTEEEHRQWWEELSEVDRRWKERDTVCHQPSLKDNLLEWHQRRSFFY